MTRSRELAELATAYDTGGLSSFKNRIINGDMRIDQRNAGASVTLGFPVDRWASTPSGFTFTMQQNAGVVTPPAGFTNYLGVTSGAANSIVAGSSAWIGQRVEGFNCSDLGWGAANAQPVTLSFWVRSSLTGTFGGSLTNGAATRSYPFSYTISSANTWEQKSITISGDITGTWLTNNGIGVAIYFQLGVGSTYTGTAGSWAATLYTGTTGAVNPLATNGATFYITGVQLEKGSTATSFDYRPYGTELALCQRYYYKLSGDLKTVSGENQRVCLPETPVSMRSTPAVSSDFIFRTETGATTIASPTYAGIDASGSCYTSQTTAGINYMSTVVKPVWSAEL